MRFLVLTTGRRGVLARVLEDSIRAVHPDASISQLRWDARLSEGVPDDAVLPHLFDFDGLRWADLAMAFDSSSAGWAAVPWVLGDNREPVVVLEDTFEAFGPLDGLFAGHAPAARSLRVDASLGAWGGFAPGLLVIPPGFGESAWGRWWKDRVAEAAATAQLATQLAVTPDPWWELPVGVSAITDPAYCLSARTAPCIELGDPATGPALVDFTGFDPRRPWWFAEPDSDHAAPMGDAQGLRQLCRTRSSRLLKAGWTPEVELEPSPLPGVRCSAEMRSWYRGLLARRDENGLPANPLVAGEVPAFLGLLGGPGGPDGSGAGRHVDLLMERRPDLRRAFPHARWRDREEFGRWLWSHGLQEGETSLLTLPAPLRGRRTERDGVPKPFGVNLVGYLDADLGLGVAARRLQRAFDAAGVPHTAVSYDRTSSNLRAAPSGVLDAPYHFNLMVITPDQLPLFVEDVGEGFLAGHHNIGLWYWESDALAPQQMDAFGYVEEVWVATNYLRTAFESAALVPVSVVPPALVFDPPDVAVRDRARLGLDDRFTFLFSFDFLSVVDRKNPLGLVEAYRRAFPHPFGGTRLILKSINGDLFAPERERIAAAVADRSDIELWDRLLPASDRLALTALADCYVSLHRAEGLGLTMAEAMAVGTPVIATAYSGNLDFMPEGSALLVPATVIEVGPGHYYPAHGHWADPDLDEAALMMRRVREDATLRQRLSVAGGAALEPFSFEAAGARARALLLESWRSSSAAAASSART